MKLFNKNKGYGALIFRDEGKKYTLAPNAFLTVPDEIGERLLKNYPALLTTDEDARAAKAEKTTAVNENAALKEQIKELTAQVSKLQLIASQPPAEEESKKVEKLKAKLKERDAEVAELTAQIEKLTNPASSV